MPEEIFINLQATSCIENAFNAGGWTDSYTGSQLRLDGTMLPQEGERREMMYLGGSAVYVDSDVAQYIREEAANRGVGELEVYEEEMQAQRDIAAINLSADEWLEVAQRSGAPEYMKGEAGGPCPF